MPVSPIALTVKLDEIATAGFSKEEVRTSTDELARVSYKTIGSKDEITTLNTTKIIVVEFKIEKMTRSNISNFTKEQRDAMVAKKNAIIAEEAALNLKLAKLDLFDVL